MLNNLINFFNLLSTKFVKKKADPDDVLILGVPDKRYDGGYKPVMIKVKDFGGGGGPVCDITMEPQTITFGPQVNFVHPDFSSITVRDVINPGFVEITRDNNQGIFNPVQEGGYNFGLSPQDTGWNAGGWFDLSDVAERTYTDWRTCILNTFGTIPAQVGQELVMVDYTTGKYYAIKFTQWTQGGGGGFAYERREVIVSEKCKLTFSDGTKLNSAAGLVTGSVTETIDPNGFVTYNVNAGLNYSNVAFVDPINGNNATAVINRADKPFTSISSALSAVSSVATSTTARGLVYIRRGTYSASDMSLYYNFVDVYCEPGVVFNGGTCYVGVAETNVYGQSKWTNNAWIRANNAVNTVFEIDTAVASASFLLLDNFCTGRFILKANNITTVGNTGPIGINLRGSGDWTIDIKEYILGSSWLFAFRYASGNIVINCPKMIIDDCACSNGCFKGAFGFYENYGVRVTINGDIYSRETFYRGCIASAITFWAGVDANVKLNGNIYGGFSIGVGMFWASPNAQLVVNGSISSSTQAIYNATNAVFIQQNGFVHSPSTLVNPMIRLINNARAYFVNVGFKNEASNLNDITIENALVELNLQNCAGQSAGTGEFIFSTVPVNVRLHNVRANKALNANVTDVLTPTGFINDPQTIVYTFK